MSNKVINISGDKDTYVLEMVVRVFDSFDPQSRERCGAAQTQEAVQKKSGGMKISESVLFA